MSETRPLTFNGKFYGGQLNGVHRVADRLIRACDDILAQSGKRPARLIAPRTSDWLPKLEHIEIVTVERCDAAWEQLVLPRLAKDDILVNLANIAPILHSRKITMVHDAQFLFSDSGYTLRQKLGYKHLVPLACRSSKRVVTVSEYSRRMLDVLRVSGADFTSVVPNGVDHILESSIDERYVESLGLEKNGFVVLFGSPKPYKNISVVLDAFADGALDPLKLVMVGPGRKTLESAGLRPPEDAVFAGPIPDTRLRALFSEALALAFPSKTEGFGLPPLEAMICGCPAIVSPAGAIPEACADAALYADPSDPIGWREAILEIKSEQSLRQSKIERGEARARRFHWHGSARRLLEIIEHYGEADLDEPR